MSCQMLVFSSFFLLLNKIIAAKTIIVAKIAAPIGSIGGCELAAWLIT